MAHLTLRTLLMNNDELATNIAMVEDLQRARAVHSPECIAAFKKVDRGHFWVEGSGSIAYADMPLRHGKLHQSAPHIYARALEALMPLRQGMSFLNVGSGTGYFSSLVHELIGEDSINDGIDIWPENVSHAEDRCRTSGRRGIEFSTGNIYQLDINVCMRYDRIYIGACANQHAKYLYDLLELGGILVAPFQSGHSQQLRRVVRQSETQFKVDVLNSVHFASLIEPAPTAAVAPSSMDRFGAVGEAPEAVPPAPSTVESEVLKSGASPIAGLPGVPFTFALRQQPWTSARCWAFPATFRCIVATVVNGQVRDKSQLCLPPEIWVSHILPWCPRWWFEPKQVPPPSLVASSRLLAALEVVKRMLLARRDPRAAALQGEERAPAAASSAVGPARTGLDIRLAPTRRLEPLDGEALTDDTGSEVSRSSESAANEGPVSFATPGEGHSVWLLAPEQGGREPAFEGGVRRGLGRTAWCFWRCVGHCCQILPAESLRRRCKALRRVAARGISALRGRRGQDSSDYQSVVAPPPAASLL